MSIDRKDMDLSEAKVLECKALAYFLSLRFASEVDCEEEKAWAARYISDRQLELVESTQEAFSSGACPMKVCSIVASAPAKARTLVTNNDFQKKETEDTL